LSRIIEGIGRTLGIQIAAGVQGGRGGGGSQAWLYLACHRELLLGSWLEKKRESSSAVSRGGRSKKLIEDKVAWRRLGADADTDADFFCGTLVRKHSLNVPVLISTHCNYLDPAICSSWIHPYL
jgi:hypothetical protein